MMTALQKSRFETLILESSAPMVPLPADEESRIKALPGVKVLLMDVYGTVLISGSGDIGVSINDDDDAGDFQPMKDCLEACGFSPSGTEDHITKLFRGFIAEEHERLRAAGTDHPEVDIRNIWNKVLNALNKENLIRGEQKADCADELALRYELTVNPVWPMPDFPEILHRLKDAGIRLGIVSNAQFYTPLILKVLTKRNLGAWGIEDELTVWSWMLRRAKPSPLMFAEVLSKLKADGIEPGEVLYIGNDMLNDISSANAAGCRSALFAGDKRSLRTRKGDPRCVGVVPDLVLTELKQLDILT